MVERFAPGIGVRAATRMWFTVPPAMPRSLLPPPPRGRDAHLELDGRMLYSTVWGAGPPVYLVHGWGGRSEQLGGFVAPLVAAGHRVVAFDAPAHGASGPGRFGATSTIPEFASALHAAVLAHGRPHAVIAHSMGATATAFALREGVRPGRLVLLAPMGDPRAMLGAFADQLGLGTRVRAGLERSVQHRIGLPFEAFDVAATAGVVAVPPTLVVHDRGDREVASAESRTIAAAWPGSRLVLTEGLGHRKLLRDAGVLEDVVGFVRAPLRDHRGPA
ncbi:alpha/beta hydrolase [Pseudonocardia sp. GCM10023141]|uniref:alpha/beta hydrolase n=1 Tax=Pseudonocardia sp. GCM10023141 TaxID=3252653 RepID=UPI003614DF42